MTYGSKGNARHSCGGFSLVELLVVISIIGLLAGLSSVAVSNAIKAGKKAKAKGDLTAIVSAVKAYKLEYGMLPNKYSSTDDEYNSWYGDPQGQAASDAANAGKDLMKILSGKNVEAGWPRGMNPKGVRFLEGPDPEGNYLDPWKHQYCVKMDINDSGALGYGTDQASENLKMEVVAISLGLNGIQDDPKKSSCDDIFSWGKNLSN